MPLLGKERFYLKSLPDDLPLDEQVFFCNITGEAFLSYDEYFERQFLYSSLLWTCSVTGKTGLTYSEARKSESESQTLLSSIPRLLQKVLLHLMTYQDTFSTNVAISLLIDYTNLRYFIGENIQVLYKNKKINGLIREVLPPENYDDSHTVAYGVDPLLYNYIVEYYQDEKVQEVVPACRISRSKCLLTREKIRLFIKQHLAAKNGRYGTLSIKNESFHKFGLENLKWEDIFKGPVPNFKDDTLLLIKGINRKGFPDEYNVPTNNNDSNEENSMDSNKTDERSTQQVMKKKSNLLSQTKMKLIRREEKYKKDDKGKKLKKDKFKKLKQKIKTGKKRSVENGEIKEEKKERKSKVNIKNREKKARKQYEEDLKAYMEKRDDLLCDDLAPLPQSTPIECGIEPDLIGDSLGIIDFLNVYQKYIIFQEDFPSFITIDYFSQILNDNNVIGERGFGDLLIALLNTILMTGRTYSDILQINETSSDGFDIFNQDDEDRQPTNPNNYINHWITTYFSTHEQLSKLDLDCFTLSEILRIYILKTRNFEGKFTSKMCEDDITLSLKLSTLSVFELNQSDRIRILKILLNDLVVKVPDMREKIENSLDEMFKLKIQIRHINAAYTRWLRDNPIRQRIRKKKTCNLEQDDGENSEQEIEISQEEKEQYKKDKTHKELQMKSEVAALKARIRKLSAFVRPRPLGIDRAYRRYWVFNSIPGLFVEHSIETDGTVPSCFDNPLPMAKPDWSQYLANIKKSKKRLKQKEKETQEELKEEQKEWQLSIKNDNYDRCSGNPLTCAVHGTKSPKIQWSFYTKEHLDSLMESLNSRGFRESDLKNSLSIEKQTILSNHLEEFDPFVLNKNYVSPTSTNDFELDQFVRKSERLQIHDKTKKRKNEIRLEMSDKPPIEILDIYLRDKLLNFEDNVYNGCFSSFSSAERDVWYTSMERIYPGNKIQSLSLLISKLISLAKSIRPFCLLPPLMVNPEPTISSPSEKENIGNNQILRLKRATISEKWLDVLKIPKSLSQGEELNLNDFESTFGIGSHSQMFVNVNIFEKSLNWNLSALKTANKCGICKKKANNEMILCDKCNRGFHLFCLNLPIKSVNDVDKIGDWYCQKCLPRPPQEKNKSTQMNDNKNSTIIEANNNVVDDNENMIKDEAIDESLLDRCKSCRKNIYEPFSAVPCKTCEDYFHLKCVNLVRIPRSWNCTSCRAKQRYEDKYQSQEMAECSELRRSQRKRKPNHYLEFEPNDENYLTTAKSKRPSLYEDTNNNRQQKNRNRLSDIDKDLL